ncbi:dna repair protein : DNA repair protein RecO OS=Planctomyces limnophilus (strain ATCC 43296 / DSM 3776 / IFAM 1008 / 290) GN=recO PE=3 SV=1: RecO_N: RecO_C [Gemmata massiliana]|uniref:DNA repair protein RecO n=1 Tax=Gemmata massiliana TaxID=1210884 RepID=A0A6P2D037_9BACT|nr:DNA repair protein RecO [Gemmata massiliana]VTR94611.1 dna repair protein : DNA repair protein RecO OS=Planctomyces limnophilus (strain ATCC 43296 / DSM 3776 / IFAM 1008 / 290) GN=recO PE=3 SV=1: RecO_N: RecO_C [Gemmata massiliana]
MAADKALAIVVRGTDWSETSRIATLFTREFGKVRALAKGGRRLKSNFDVAFDLLTVCEVVFIRKASGLDLLTEARMNEQFPTLRQNLSALYAGYYVAELLADGTQDYDPHPPLFDAAIQTLRSLGKGRKPNPLTPFPRKEGGTEPKTGIDTPQAPVLSPSPFRGGVGEGLQPQPTPPSPLPEGKGDGGVGSPTSGNGGLDLAARVSAFELVWLQELGYSPRLEACATCGRERLNPTARAFFSPSAGGVLCPECGPAVADRRMVSGESLETIRALSAGGAGPELPPGVRTEVRQVLGYAVSCVLGRRPRLLSFVDAR